MATRLVQRLIRGASSVSPSSESAAPIVLPPQRQFTYPPDVADATALRTRLAETDLFGLEPREAHDYLNVALERFRVTLALLPPLPPGARVLELGANPYFLTRLLRERGLDVRAANWFGEGQGFADKGTQEVVESGRRHIYEFDHFNVERDPFPYESGTFDLVLFCEILEHLPCDPTHTLVEIHRVLKPEGTMLLTTPNAARLENLVKVQRGENMYEELSGYGVYGRHNREYTIPELQDLLGGCGYDIDDVLAIDVWQRPDPPIFVPGIRLEDRGENIFAVARPARQVRWYYPRWLYQSIHAYRRVVQPNLVVGTNCDVQAVGLHELEDFEGRPGRWTDGGGETVVWIAPDPEERRLRIEGRAPEIGGMMELVTAVAGTKLTWSLPCDGAAFMVEGEVQFDVPYPEIRLSCDRAWRRSEIDPDSRDSRALGFVLHRVAAEPMSSSSG